MLATACLAGKEHALCGVYKSADFSECPGSDASGCYVSDVGVLIGGPM